MVASCWLLLLIHTMMHGSMNVKRQEHLNYIYSFGYYSLPADVKAEWELT